MRTSLEIKAAILGIAVGLITVSIAFAASKLFQPRPVARGGTAQTAVPKEGTLENQGYKLYQRNCAYCHGADATGDEGPDLHDLAKSDAGISSMILGGIKGEMPKFGEK